MKVLRFLFRSAPSIVIAASAAAMLSGTLNAGLIVIVHRALTDTNRISWLLAAAFIGLVIGKLATAYVAEMVLVQRSQKCVAELRRLLIRRLLGVPFRHFEKVGPARIYSTLTDDVESISTALYALPGLVANLAVLAGGTAYLCYLSWRALLVLLVLVLFGATLYLWISRHAAHFFELARDEYDRLCGHFRALTEGTKELKLHRGRRSAFVDGEVVHTTEALMRHNIQAHSRYFLGRVTSNLLFFVALGLTIFLLPSLTDLATHAMSGYLLTCIYLMGPLTGALQTSPIFARARVAFDRVEQLGINLRQRTCEEDSIPAEAVTWERIELRGVTHSYERQADERSFLLGPVDLELRPGELLFITGGNGSGKSTLAKILTGLYQPEEGDLHWDGERVADHNRDSYRQLFSAVFSDFHLFKKLLGLDAPDLDQRAEVYMHDLRLGEKVTVEGGVLSSIELSSGQRRRLALLTACLEDRPLLLLDEWAADQDPTFKEIFYKQLIPELRARGKTVIVITHDDRYFQFADRQIKMEDGRIVSIS